MVLQIFWGVVIHSILISTIVSCFGLILHPLASVLRFQSCSYVLVRVWFAMYNGSGTCVSFIGTALGPTAEIFGYSHKYTQCT